jgi:hypothetical protein
MNSRFLILHLLFAVSIVCYGQTTVFGPTTGSIPTGWTGINGNTAQAIAQSNYLLLETGAPGDTLLTSVYDLSTYGSAAITLDVATFATGAYNPVKIEVSLNSGTSYTQTLTSNTPTGPTTYISGGTLTLTSISSSVQIRITNAGASGRGIRIQNLKLTGIGTPCSSPINVSGTTTTSMTNSLIVDWTNSTCYDEVVAFIDQTSGIGASPSGGAGSYSGNSVYASNGQCVYTGFGTSITITGLTNDSTYYIELFTRRDTTWSSGVEVSGIPSFNGLSIGSSGTSAISFDATLAGVNNGAYAGSGLSTSPSAGQLNSNSWEIIGFTGGNFSYTGTQTNAEKSRGISTGGVNSGGLYAFEVDSGNRALGIQPSGAEFTPGSVGLRFMNNTGATVTDLTVAYDLYVYADQARANSFNFSYSANGSSFSSENILDFSSDEAATAGKWRLNKRFIHISGISLAHGSLYYVRWSGDDISGAVSRDEFALDNITITLSSSAPSAATLSTIDTLESLTCKGLDLVSANHITTDYISLNNSILTLGNYNLQIVDTAFVGSDSEYIATSGTGRIIKNWTGNGSFLYPIGHNGYTPVTLNFTSGTYGASATASALVVDSAHYGLSSVTDFTSRYWKMDTSSITSYTADVSAVYLDADVNGTESNMYALHWDGSIFTSHAPTVTSTNTLNFSSISALDDITGSEVAALPVQLLYFKGEAMRGYNSLSWASSFEANCSHYVVLKSQDAINYSPLEKVYGAGNSQRTNEYQYMDKRNPHTSYYKLSQYDYDGKQSFLKPILIIQGSQPSLVVSYELDKIVIFHPYISNYKYSLLDLMGKQILEGEFSGNLEIGTSGLRKAIYHLMVYEKNGEFLSTKIEIR